MLQKETNLCPKGQQWPQPIRDRYKHSVCQYFYFCFLLNELSLWAVGSSEGSAKHPERQKENSFLTTERWTKALKFICNSVHCSQRRLSQPTRNEKVSLLIIYFHFSNVCDRFMILSYTDCPFVCRQSTLRCPYQMNMTGEPFSP